MARLGCVIAIALAFGCSKKRDDARRDRQGPTADELRPTPSPPDPACAQVVKSLPPAKNLGGLGAAVELVADGETTWTRDCRAVPAERLAGVVTTRLTAAKVRPATGGAVVDRARELGMLGPAREHDRTAGLSRIAEGPRGPMAPVALLLAANAPATRASEIATAAGPLCLQLVANGARRAPMPRVWVCGKADPAPSAAPVISVLIASDRIWVGVAAINERRELHDLDALAAALAEHKASPRFDQRTDLEIAAKPDAQYRELVAAIDVAIAAGFVDVTALPASALATRFQL